MLALRCPWCGPRDEVEFTFGGERAVRPDPQNANDNEWAEYLYFRGNARGWIREYWVHSQGCAQWFVVVRDTVTNAVLGSWAAASDDIKVPT